MRRVIIESPYSSGTKRSIPAVVARNVRYLRACMRDAVLRGETPYASHGLLTQEGVLDDTVPAERAAGIAAGFAWRAVADATVFYTDLGWSAGMLLGRVHAEDTQRHREHQIEQRIIGGRWGLCIGCVCPVAVIGPGPDHDYDCPLWRKRE